MGVGAANATALYTAMLSKIITFKVDIRNERRNFTHLESLWIVPAGFARRVLVVTIHSYLGTE
jgi:hypothetical protein